MEESPLAAWQRRGEPRGRRTSGSLACLLFVTLYPEQCCLPGGKSVKLCRARHCALRHTLSCRDTVWISVSVSSQHSSCPAIVLTHTHKAYIRKQGLHPDVLAACLSPFTFKETLFKLMCLCNLCDFALCYGLWNNESGGCGGSLDVYSQMAAMWYRQKDRSKLCVHCAPALIRPH